MQKCFGEGTGRVYQDVLSWLQSTNTELQLSGALAIANFARNGEEMNMDALWNAPKYHSNHVLYDGNDCNECFLCFLLLDSNCVKMLELGVVPYILDLLEQHVTEGDVSVQHAGLSALRNLAIPGVTFVFFSVQFNIIIFECYDILSIVGFFFKGPEYEI